MPALSEKALMGVRVNFSEIAFDIVFPVADTQPLWERVSKSAINWGYTNWKGMTFGLLFAAAILNFLSNLSRRKFKNSWLNTILGVATGAPLGVCVNCATPISHAIHNSGARIETSLAALISSPTLNVIVLSMTFTLLPLSLALGKLISVLVLIALIPWLVKLSKLDLNLDNIESDFSVTTNLIAIDYGWFTSFKAVLFGFIKHFIYIIKIALPLMLLAGLIGALAIELFPYSQINKFESSFINMLGLALIGVFLPVPIAFDVLTGVALLSSGASMPLVAVLLFSLGSFSIYPWLMISKNISLRLSVYLALLVVIISLLFGLSIKAINEFVDVDYDKNLLEKISHNEITNNEVLIENAKIVKSICESLPSNLQNKCIKSYILNVDHYRQISHQCDYLPTGYNTNECLLLVQLAKVKHRAIAKKDYALCLDLKSPYLQSECKFEVISQLAISRYSIEMCHHLEDVRMIDACRSRYLFQGIKTQLDGSVCNELVTKSEKDICFNNLNINRYADYGDMKACNKFSDKGFKLHCLYSVASRIVGDSGDVSVCNDISNKNLSNRCEALSFVRQAKKQTNSYICYSVPFADMKNKCLLDVAKLDIHRNFEGLSLKYVENDLYRNALEKQSEIKLNSNINAPEIDFETIISSAKLEIKRAGYLNKDTNNTIQFDNIDAVEFGIEKFWSVRAVDFFEPFFMGKGLASGDFNNDHWPDLVVATESGVALYKNTGGEYSLINFKNDLRDKNIFIVAFVDIDNNGFQDIYASAYGGENYIIYNYGDEFSNSKLVKYKGDQKLTISVGFADLDKNNYLDIVMGNWSNGAEKYFNPEVSQNFVAFNMGDKFVYEGFLEPKGETLSVLLSDINADANIDVLFANDHIVPDMYYFSDSLGKLKLLTDSDSIVKATPRNTMSIDSADFNNDLKLDIFSVDMVFTEGSSDDYCDNVRQVFMREQCVELVKIYDSMKGRSVSHCKILQSSKDKSHCYSAFAIMAARTNLDDKFCQHLNGELSSYKKLCVYLSKSAPDRKRIDYSNHLSQKQKNVLLISNGSTLIDKADEFNVSSSYWSWNAKAADLDNDQWQDIYVGNGYHFGDGFYEIHENILFHNVNGKKFEQVQKSWGLADKLNTSSYTYTDFDLDGDIDIIASSFMSGITFYVNNANKNNSISLKLRDSVTNTDAVGAQVSIYYGDGLKQLREIKLSGGFMSFDNPVLYFGLANYNEVKQVVIRWPDGKKTIIDTPLIANHFYTIHRKK